LASSEIIQNEPPLPANTDLYLYQELGKFPCTLRKVMRPPGSGEMDRNCEPDPPSACPAEVVQKLVPHFADVCRTTA